MISWLTFLKESIRNPRTIGSIIPSSSFLTDSMLEQVDFKIAKCIVEIGAGTGVLSSKIVKKIPKGCQLVIFEVNPKFVEILKKKVKNKAIIINDSIENIQKYIHVIPDRKADYFISSLPLALFSKYKLRKFLKSIHPLLRDEGKFIQYQYSLTSKKILNAFFTNLRLDFVLLNVPPAFIYICTK